MALFPIFAFSRSKDLDCISQETSFACIPIAQDLAFLEFFAGEGNVWRMMRADSVSSIGIDIRYSQFMGPDGHGSRQNPFDILSDAGMG